MKDRLSPNFDTRDPAVALEYIVLHYTGMKNEESALARLCDPAAKVSAHYVIGEDGAIWRLADEDKRAWHAGKSFWRGVTDVNSASVGIEMVNPGHEFGYRPFPDAQIIALKKLAHRIIARHRMSAATALLAHSDIAPARKQDPGELFPWAELAKEGLGLWPSPSPQDFAPASEDEISKMLGFIGYDTTDLSAALLAFQRRYCPEKMTGKADEESIARMRALKRLIPTAP
jgi:N-acetylmuramoyl-L-alanine amidase